jgi:TrmH family RNA methyltransferase
MGMAPASNLRAQEIASKENRWLKRFRAALRAERPEDGTLGLEGPHLVLEALRSPVAVEAILVSARGEGHLTALDESVLRETRLLRTSDRLFEGIAATETSQGIAALARMREWVFEDVLRGGVPLVVVLVGVQDPGNVGAAVRSAEAFAATGVIASRGTAHPFSAKALRASAGSALRMPLVAGVAPAITLAQLRVAGVRSIAASLSGGDAPAAANLREPCALLIGGEGAGLPGEIERSADARVRIPIAAPVDSLNAAVAAAVLLYEAARQRGRN